MASGSTPRTRCRMIRYRHILQEIADAVHARGCYGFAEDET